MPPQTQSAAVRHASAGTTATRNPSLYRKAGPVPKIMPHLPAFLRQRHATRQRIAALEALTATVPQRLNGMELDLMGLHAQVTGDSILMGTTSVQQAGIISAQTRRSDEAACAALAELIWTPAERLAFHAMRADADGAA